MLRLPPRPRHWKPQVIRSPSYVPGPGGYIVSSPPLVPSAAAPFPGDGAASPSSLVVGSPPTDERARVCPRKASTPTCVGGDEFLPPPAIVRDLRRGRGGSGSWEEAHVARVSTPAAFSTPGMQSPTDRRRGEQDLANTDVREGARSRRQCREGRALGRDCLGSIDRRRSFGTCVSPRGVNSLCSGVVDDSEDEPRCVSLRL